MTGTATSASFPLRHAFPARAAMRSWRWLATIVLLALAMGSAAATAEPPAVPAPAVPYYVAEGGAVRGPVSLDVVTGEIGEGRVVPWTLVWKPGLSGWIRAGDLPELSEALAAATPRPPPPPAQPPPPPVDLPAEDLYFVADGEATRGPLSEAEVVAAIAAGEIVRATLLWQVGTPDWIRADTAPAFAGRFTLSPPEIPAAERMRQLMVGTWEFAPAQGEVIGTRTRLTFHDDMTVAGEVSVAVPGDTPVVRSVSGEWAVEDASAERFTLLLMVGGEPARVRLRVVDPDALENETDGGDARRLAG